MCITAKYQRGFAGYGPGTTTKNYRCSASSAADNGMCITTKYQRGFAGYGPSITTKYYRCSVRRAAGYGPGITTNYQRGFAGWSARASRMTSEPFHQGGNLFVRARRSV